MFSYVFLQFSKLYSLFLAPCTLFSCSSHIYESYCIHELGAHKYLLLPPLPKLWYHCACFPTLSFITLSWSCMIDASICVILAINIFHCHCHYHCHWWWVNFGTVPSHYLNQCWPRSMTQWDKSRCLSMPFVNLKDNFPLHECHGCPIIKFHQAMTRDRYERVQIFNTDFSVMSWEYSMIEWLNAYWMILSWDTPFVRLSP